MPRTKVRECTDDCGGVMKLANVADGIPLWTCRSCDARDQSSGTTMEGVYWFERDNPQPDGPYTPFAPDDPPQDMDWETFLETHSEQLDEAV